MCFKLTTTLKRTKDLDKLTDKWVKALQNLCTGEYTGSTIHSKFIIVKKNNDLSKIIFSTNCIHLFTSY